MTGTHAFIDESKRGPYLMCVFVAESTARNEVRRALTGLLEGGERRLHMKDERDSRKRLILSTLADVGIHASVFSSRTRPQYEARERILRRGIWPMLTKRKVERLVLEAEAGQDERDRKVLFELTRSAGLHEVFTYHHEVPRSEPMLWIPDAIAWGYGKGGEWRERVRPLLVDVTDVDRLQ